MFYWFRVIVCVMCFFFFFQAEDGIRDLTVTGVQTCALPISPRGLRQVAAGMRDRARQELPIELLEEPIPGIVIAVVRPRAGCVLQAETPVAGRGRYTKERDIRGADLRRRLEQHDRVLDDVLQLAHVAGPRVRL